MVDTSHENRRQRARFAEMRWKQRIAAWAVLLLVFYATSMVLPPPGGVGGAG